MSLSSNKKTNKSNNNNPTPFDPISALPIYSLEIYEDDYFKELILEPLSFLLSGDVVVVKSPTKKQQQIIVENIDNDSDNSDTDQDNSISSQYYCPFCKKKFQTEQTWNTHINSSKHLKSIKDQKKKSTTNTTPTKQNNAPSLSTATTSSPKPTSINSTKDNEFIQDQINQIQQAIKVKNTKPNLACKNLFTIARSYCQRQYIRDSAKTLSLLIGILTSTTTTTTTNGTTTTTITIQHSLNNINNTATLLCKTHLYFGRLTRLFQQSLSEYHFLQSFNNLNLISTEQLSNYEQSLIQNTSSPITLYNIFLNQLNQQQPSSPSPSPSVEQITILNNYINEISGGLCYCQVNYKSIVLYILSSCITFKYGMYRESLESNSRALKIIISLKQYHWSIDLLLNNLILNCKLQDNNTTPTEETNQNLIISILKYCILIDDKIRLANILDNNEYFKSTILKYQDNELITCCSLISKLFQFDNYKEIDIQKDNYEHLISFNKELSFIFNQLDLKKKLLLQ